MSTTWSYHFSNKLREYQSLVLAILQIELQYRFSLNLLCLLVSLRVKALFYASLLFEILSEFLRRFKIYIPFIAFRRGHGRWQQDRWKECFSHSLEFDTCFASKFVFEMKSKKYFTYTCIEANMRNRSLKNWNSQCRRRGLNATRTNTSLNYA